MLNFGGESVDAGEIPIWVPASASVKLLGGNPQAVIGVLTADANSAGLSDFDFSSAVNKAAFQSTRPTGWAVGAGTLQIANAILDATGNPALQALRVDESTAPFQFDAAAGVARDQASHDFLAKQSDWKDFTSFLPGALAVWGGVALAGAAIGGAAAFTGGTVGATADALTAAGDIGGLAFPTTAATTAAQWGTLGATDALTLAGDIGGAAFPTDAATAAAQWGTAGATSTVTAGGLSQALGGLQSITNAVGTVSKAAALLAGVAAGHSGTSGLSTSTGSGLTSAATGNAPASGVAAALANAPGWLIPGVIAVGAVLLAVFMKGKK